MGNTKQTIITDVLRIVVEECTNTISDVLVISCDDVTGKCKTQNLIMTRCLFVGQLHDLGYSDTTISAVIHRHEKAVADILCSAEKYKAFPVYSLTERRIRSRVNRMIADIEEGLD